VNNYNDEVDKLFDWAMQEIARIDKEYPPGPGLDGEHMHECKKHISEFNRRLLALKTKYGIDVAAVG